MDRGAWRAIVHGITKESDMTECAHTHTHTRGRDNAIMCSAMPSRSVVPDSATPWTVALQALPSRNSPGKSTGVGCHSLLQGIFPDPGACISCIGRQILYHRTLLQGIFPIQVSCFAGRFLMVRAFREAQCHANHVQMPTRTELLMPQHHHPPQTSHSSGQQDR